MAKIKKKKPTGKGGTGLRSERFGADPRRPLPQTPEQRTEIERQEVERAKPKPLDVEVRRVETREEVTALEDRPGVTPPELTPEVKAPVPQLLNFADDSFREAFERLNQPITPERVEAERIIGLKAAGGGVGGRLVSVTNNGIRLVASEGLSLKAVQETAAGKLTKSVITEKIKLGGGKVMTNTYTVKKGISLLSRMSGAGKWALGTFGVLSGLAFAGQFLVTQTYNDSTDALDGYKFSISQAERDEDFEEVAILTEQFNEMYAVWEETNGLQIFNYPAAANRKIQQSKDVIDSVNRRIKKALEELTPTWEEARAKTFGAAAVGGVVKTAATAGKVGVAVGKKLGIPLKHLLDKKQLDLLMKGVKEFKKVGVDVAKKLGIPIEHLLDEKQLALLMKGVKK